MPNYINTLANNKDIQPPKWMAESIQYECIMGSLAYGVSSDNSDVDVYAICIPPKHIIFPYEGNKRIVGFGKKPENFEVWQQHHVHSNKYPKQEFDMCCYNIVKFFQLAMENNPNIIDSLFVPQRCVTSSTEIGQYIRHNRKLFLHKGSVHKLKGYAYSQLSKMRNRSYENSKRKEVIEKYGYDVKHAYHIVRLVNQAEQILTEGDLDLELCREQLKSIRKAEWTFNQIVEYFERKEKTLEELYHTSNAIPHSPDEAWLQSILVECLEMYYGSIERATPEGKEKEILHEISQMLRSNGY